MRPSIGAVAAICMLATTATAQTPAPVPVGTVTAERRPISKSPDFVGRVEAVNRLEVRARVNGFLEEVLFREGDMVKEGDELYHIEKGLFEAAVQQAQGAVERSKAALVLAQQTLDRAADLYARAAGTAVARDQAQAQVDTAKGAVLSDEANLSTAKINLGYTSIATPIAGKISRTNVTKGNVVGPGSGPLTMVVSQDPMYLTFPVSQRDFLKMREAGKQLNFEDFKSIKVRARFSDGTTYNQVGTVNFVDVRVDPATDTILARATMPNPDGGLVDNQLVRVAVEIGSPDEKVVVPQAALIADQEGTYVFIVDNGKAVVRRLKLGGESGSDVVVEDGLSGGEQVITEGLQGVRPGLPVSAAPVRRAVSEK
jgi:membrane fusion protein (multidrug efflux system)